MTGLKYIRVSVMLLFAVWFLSPVPAFANLNERYLGIQQQIKKEPNNLNLKMDLAYLYSQGLEFNRAIRLYEEILLVQTQNIRAITELCVLFTQMRQQDRALPMCQQATVVTPQNYLAFDNLGLSYFKLGQYRESLRPFVSALALKPKSVPVLYHLSQTYMALGEYQAAKSLLSGQLSEGLSVKDQSLVLHGLYQVNRLLKDWDGAYLAVKASFDNSDNPMYVSKVVAAYLKSHQFMTFLFLSLVVLWFCNYMGKRLNRFLKNE